MNDLFLILLTVCWCGFGIAHFIQDKQEGYVGKIEDVTVILYKNDSVFSIPWVQRGLPPTLNSG